jgi:SAM-dependent methyltransferase
MARQAKGSRYDRLYASGGFGYETCRPHWREWVRRHYVEAFDLRPPERVLDIPCGDGFWTSVFGELGFDAAGVDLSPGGVDVARSKYAGVDFAVGNAEEDLPFPDRSFDVAFSRGITHLHRSDLFRDASVRMARNLMRYVRPGGLLLVSYYTKRDGSEAAHHAQHPFSDLVRLFEAVGDVFRVEVVDDYVQIGVQHRDAPRVQARPTSPTAHARRLARGLLLRWRCAVRRRLPVRSRDAQQRSPVRSVPR